MGALEKIKVSHMRRPSFLVPLFLALVLTGISRAQEPASAPPAENIQTSPQPVTFLPSNVLSPPGVKGPDGPVTMKLDPCTGFPPEGPPISLFSPFEFYSRTGVALNTGRGPLAGDLRVGIGVEGGVRSFLYNESRTAAWYGDLGVTYLYNGAESSSTGLPRTGVSLVTRAGQTLALNSVSFLGVHQLHRTNARFALGREFYIDSRWVEGLRFVLGGDFGGVWGNASVKTSLISDLEATDQVLDNPRDSHSSDVIKGFFLGTNFNLILPRQHYDFILGTRLDWERHYFSLFDNDDGASQLKLYLELGWRF